MRRILWFRRDLRVKDNPLLSYEGEVLPIFIFDKNILGELKSDDRRVSFIFHYVCKLKEELQKIGLDLKVFYAQPQEVFKHLLTSEFDEVLASGDYDSYAKKRDIDISHMIKFKYINDTYIFKPKEVVKDDSTPYLVFTPFYKKAREILKNKNIDEVMPSKQSLIDEDYDGITEIKEAMLSKLPLEIESIGFKEVEIEIRPPYDKLSEFKNKIASYKEKRDFFSIDATSKLSVDLRFGTIGIREVLRFLFDLKDVDVEPFIRQLIFRDFYAYLLFHMPRVENENFRYKFNGINDHKKFELFCTARTGVPIIDAGVRELLQSGNMHNRVRMIVSSFFTKNLLLPWQWGESFFAKHLLDYDKASNVLSWQWSAGTGVDPQPYFRIFNPYVQSKKYDKDALYIKKYLSELKDIEPKEIHNEEFLLNADIKGYQRPMVKYKESSKNALNYFKNKI